MPATGRSRGTIRAWTPAPSGPRSMPASESCSTAGSPTQLEAQGADLSDALWSARLLVEDPAAIVDAHLAYYRAGARVATTASYQATFEGFARRGIGRDEAERAASPVRRAGRRGAGQGRGGVARRAGPLRRGVGRAVRGDARRRLRVPRPVRAARRELKDFHRDRLRVLAATDADVLAVETIPEVEEAAAVAALLAETPGAAAWVSFACADGQRIRSGAPIEEAVGAVATTPRRPRGRRQLHGARARAGAHRADRRRDRAARRRVPQQRRGVGRGRPHVDRGRRHRRRWRGGPRVGRRAARGSWAGAAA